MSPKCKSSISDFCTVNKDVEELAVGQCEQSDPRGGGGGGQSEASESSFNLWQGLAVCQCEQSDPRGRGERREPQN